MNVKKTILDICLFIFCFIILFRFSYSFSFSVKPTIEYPPEELPSLIIAYNLLIKGYGEGDNYINKRFQDLKRELYFVSKLDSGFKGIPEIYNSLGFSNLTFIIQSNIEGYISGFPTKEKNIDVPFESIMFVTTPMESINKSILVILSTVSPEHTTIIRVDQKLNISLLFDSTRNKLPDGTVICSIISVRVIKPGIFLLEERRNNRCSYPEVQRYFILDTSTGSIKVSEQTSKGH